MAGPRTIRVLTALTGALVLGLSAALAQGAPILPTGGSVAAGHAAIAPAGNGTVITQSSQKAIINWQSFSVGAGSSVTFEQPGSAAIALNRVLGAGASTINGNVTANGQVWIINSNGILFGAGSRIDVGGLIATTSNIRDSNFLAGIYDFDIASGNPNAAVINRGAITTANGGSAVLSGARVVNDGVIQAKLGKVVLGGASGFSVDFDGDNLIRYAVGAPVSETPKNADGTPAPALVSNSGTIAADGGKILLTTRAARSVVNNVINSTGIVEANSASLQNGEIVFDAGEGGITSVAGKLDASGKDSGSAGGKIALLGETVKVADGAKLDASGDSGGGTILIGGNLHGAGPEANAQSASVGQADIAADAGSNGNGGTVAIYSTGQTDVAASITAHAGAKGGDGGTVETSGHDLHVAQTTHVDTSAPAGATGSWLLDPLNINVALGGSTTLSGGVDAVGTHPGATDVISPATIIGALASTNVRLEASNDITIFDSIAYSSGNSLTFLAGRNVTFNASVQNGGAGAIFAVAGWDGVTAAPSILTTPGAYGSNNGTVLIGGGSASGGVAVGTATGTTSVAAQGLVVQGQNGFATLGYNLAASGTIAVKVTGELAVLGGSGNVGGDTHAQIGNGGGSSSGNSSGNITLAAGGNVLVTAGTDAVSYAQIGNGAASTVGNSSGAIDVTAGGYVVLTGGSSSVAYAQIGNGGASSSGIHTGTLDVSVDGNVVLTGGTGSVSYAQIGHGGMASSGSYSGDIDVAVDGNVVLTGGTGAVAYAQLGHGGISSSGSHSGDIAVTAGADFILAGNGGASTYALIGHGGALGTGSHDGDISIIVDGSATVGRARIGNQGGTIDGSVLFIADTNLTLGNGASVAGSSSGDAVVLASQGNFVNQTGSGVLSVSGGGRWLIFLRDPTKNVTPGGLSGSTVNHAFDFQTGAYAPIAAAGNQFVYVPAQILTVTADNLTKNYGNANPTFTYQITGLLNGDLLANVVSGSPSLSTSATANSGVGNYAILASLGTLSSSSYGFQFVSGTLTIDPKLLTVALVGSVTKTYDGTLAASLAANNYALSGVLSGDNVALNNPTSGTYASKSVGSGKLVSVSGLALSGSDAGNYALTSTNASGAVGTINAATLTAGLTGSVVKTYDGTNAATLAPGNYTLSGVVSGDTVALNNPASGTYDTKTAGSGKLVSVSGLALSGSDAGNYVLASTNTSGAVGIINAVATVTAGLTGTVIKTYDGTLIATLAPGNYTLSGVVAGDNVVLNNPASGTYASKSVGSGKLVSVSGLALSGSDAGNYALASTSASGTIGIINAATLTPGLTGSVAKTYDGTNAASLAANNYALSGIVGGDAVALNNPASGSYDTKSAGTSKLVSVSGLALSGSDAGNYVLASANTSGSVGIINAATLTAVLTGSVVKTYDGNLVATLAPGNYTLSGAVSGDAVALNNPASGTYASKSVGTGKLVSVSGLALSGSDAGNYVLVSSTASGAVGIINAATLTAGLTGSVSKTFDGSVAATLAPNNYTLAGAVSGDAVALNNPASGAFDTKDVGTGKLVSVSGLALLGSDAANYVLASTNASGAVGEIKAVVVIDDAVLAQLGAISSINSGSSGNTTPPATTPAVTVMGAQGGPMMVVTMMGGAEETSAANVVAISVGQSLSGAAGSVASSTNVLIDGLLRQYNPPPGGARPRGIPPVDEVYSSWGNEAFWQ